MEKTPHCALNGDGALKFARRENLPCCQPKDLKALSYDIGPPDPEKYLKGGYSSQDEPKNSVCAVAIDSKGHLACALSSGKNWSCNLSFSMSKKP